MKKLNKSISFLTTIILFASFVLGSCGKMDETYREFLVDGETIYVAKADSLKVGPGRERIQLEWLVMSDPKVKRYKVYWGNRTDSIENELNRSVDGDTVRLIIDNLPGGVYEFEIFQYGDDGKASVRSTVIGRSYDESYEGYLPNRTIELAETDENGETTILWTKYRNPEMIGIDFSYVSSSGQSVNMVIDTAEMETILLDRKSQTEIKYRTMFKPDTAAIDTFYSIYNSFVPVEDVTNIYLENYRVPFARLDDWDGSRWGIVADWTVSESVKILSCKDGKCYGSWDGHNSARGNTISLQRWTKDPAAPNGKIYQTVTLPKGEYELEMNLVQSLTNTGDDARYLMVSPGPSLPDVDNLGSALAYESFVGRSTKGASVTFTLTEATEVSLGVLFHFITPEQVFNIESFKLIKNN